MRYTSLLILFLVGFAVCGSAQVNKKAGNGHKGKFDTSDDFDPFGDSEELSEDSADLDHNFEPLEADEKWFTAPLAYYNEERAADIAGQYKIFLRIYTSDVDQSPKAQHAFEQNLDIQHVRASGAEFYAVSKSALPDALRVFSQKYGIAEESELAAVRAEIEVCEKGFTLDFSREQFVDSGRAQHRHLIIATKCSDADHIEIYWNEVKHDARPDDQVYAWVQKTGVDQVSRRTSQIVFDAAFADLTSHKVQTQSLP